MDSSSVREKDIYKTSRVMYVLEAAFEYFIAIVTSGAYLAKLTTSLGISDSMTAILTAITSLAGVFQMVSVFLAHKRPAKRWVIPSQLAPNLMFAFLYLIPCLNLKRGAALLFFLLMLSAWALKSVSTPVKLSCRINLVEDKKRGQYYAILNIVSLVGSMAYTLIISSIIDKFDSEENLNGAFIALTLIIFSLTALHTLTLLLAKEKKVEVDKNQSTLKSIKHLFDNGNFRRVLIINIIFTVSSAITTPFLGTYQISELGFTLTFIAVTDVVLTIMRVLAIYLFGRLSTRKSFISIEVTSYIFSFIAYVFLMFTSRANGMVVYTIYKVLSLVTTSARSVSATNIIFDMVPQREHSSALAFNSMLVSAISFVTTLLMTPLVDFIQARGNTFLGMNVFAQQVLAAISALTVLILIIYYRVFCKRSLEAKSSSDDKATEQ